MEPEKVIDTGDMPIRMQPDMKALVPQLLQAYEDEEKEKHCNQVENDCIFELRPNSLLLDEEPVVRAVTSGFCYMLGKGIPNKIDSLQDKTFGLDPRIQFGITTLGHTGRNAWPQFQHLTDLQKRMLPAIAKGLSVVAISRSHYEKRMGYLIPILNTCALNTWNTTATDYKSPDPMFVVVCSTAQSTYIVKNLASIIASNSNIRINVLLYTALTRKEERALNEGTDVLLTTSMALAKALEERLVSLDNCQLMIFDDLDKTMLMHMEATKKIVLEYYNSAQIRFKSSKVAAHTKALMSQFVVCAEQRTDNVNTFIDTLHNPIQLFSCFLEAAIESDIELRFYTKRDEKLRDEALMEAIEELRQFTDRVVVCCSRRRECERVETLLKSQTGITTIMLLSDTPHYDFVPIRRKWSSASKSNFIVLIIIDEAITFEYCDIKNANCLINYSLPSYPVLSRRFRLISDILQRDIPKISCFLLSWKDSAQIPQLMVLLRRINEKRRFATEIPLGLKILSERSDADLCSHFAITGKCDLRPYFCSKNHHVTKLHSALRNLPSQGLIKFEVRHVINASEYYIRLSASCDGRVNRTWKQFKPCLADISQQLQELRSAEKGHVKPDDIEIGQMYAIDRLGRVDRARIKSIMGFKELQHYQEISDFELELFYVDHGYTTHATAVDLIPLPQQLTLIPPLAFKVFLVGMKPRDNEYNWHDLATQKVKQILKVENVENQELTERHYFTAWVLHQAGPYLWIDDITFFKTLDRLDTRVSGGNLFSHLLGSSKETPYAELCSKALPFFDRSTKIEIQMKWFMDRQKKKVSYAHLDDLDRVYMVHAKGPAEFYLSIAKFQVLLRNLEKELAKLKLCSLADRLRTGLYCLAKCELDGSINRALIKQVHQTTADVFYLDYGETYQVDHSSCYSIPEKLLTQLPFQAIKCSLFNYSGNCNEEVLYDLTRTEANEFKHLIAKKISKENDITAIRLFVHHSKEGRKTTYQSIAKLLVDQGIGFCKDEPVDYQIILTDKLVFDVSEDGGDDIPAEQWACHQNFYDHLLNTAKKYYEDMTGYMLHNKFKQLALNGNVLVDEGEDEDENQPQPTPLLEVPTFSSNVDRSKLLPYDPDDVDDEEEDIESDEELFKGEDATFL